MVSKKMGRNVSSVFPRNPQRACTRVAVVIFSVCVCVCACLTQTDFEDGFVLSLQMGIKARQATF